MKETIDAIVRLGKAAGAHEVVRAAVLLAERVAQGRYFLACVGQHKRGKSSVLNALLGAPLLPTGVVPLTSVVSVVRHGANRLARVRLHDLSWRDVDIAGLRDYVTEEGNPGNAKGVIGAEIALPHSLLASGLCLVDTPGIGSVFVQNTMTTRELVPHIDAAIAVLGVDPPISGDEVELLKELAPHVRHMFFVLNKTDRIPPEQLDEADRFTARIVADRLGRTPDRIYRVSAAERLRGGDGGDWAALVGAIEAVAAESGAEILRDAASRGAKRLVDRLARDLAEQRDALTRPLDASERRVATLRCFVTDAVIALGDLDHQFLSEREKLRAALGGLRDGFLERVLPLARGELTRRLSMTRRWRSAAFRREAVFEARQVAHRWLDGLRVEVEERGESAYSATTIRFTDLADRFVARLEESGGREAFDLGDRIEAERAAQVRSRVHYTDALPMAAASPQRWVLEALAPAIFLRPSIERLAHRYLARLLETNASRVANDFDDRAAECQKRFHTEIRTRLSELIATAEHALTRAREKVAEGDSAVKAELDRIDGLRRELEAAAPDTVTNRASRDAR